MSQLLYPPTRPRSIAEVLDQGVLIFKATLVKCLPYGVMATLIGQLPNIYQLARGRPMVGGDHALERFGAGDPVWWVLYVLAALGSIGLWSALILRQHAVASRQQADMGKELREAVRRLFPMLLLLIIQALMLMMLSGPVIYFTRQDVFRWVMLLPLLPAIYLLIGLLFSFFALLLTPRGPFGALAYSVRLTYGHWWRTLTVFIVMLMLVLVFYLLAATFAAMMVPLIGAGDIALVTAISSVVVVALGAVGTPFICAILLAQFIDLRVRRDGLDLEARMG